MTAAAFVATAVAPTVPPPPLKNEASETGNGTEPSAFNAER
jgi:hypothetical protein